MQVFEGLISKPGTRGSGAVELTASEKKNRVVLKRVNLDKEGVRSNFLLAGTQARVSLATSPAGTTAGCAAAVSAHGALLQASLT